MIKVNIKRKNGIVEEIKLNGHALYNEFGKDIVCAGVSSSLTTTINAIIRIDKQSIVYEENNTFLIKNIKKDEITNKLLDNFIDIIKQISKNYGKNIKIKEENYE